MTKEVKDELQHKEEVKNKDSENDYDKLKTNKDSKCDEDTENSDSEFEDKNYFNNSKTGCLIKEMNEKDLQKFCKKKENELQREKMLKDRNREVIQRFLNRKTTKMNKIFDDPYKSVPLPRKSCTINVTFTERAFPTPARESCHLQEQEVNIPIIYIFSIILMKIPKKNFHVVR